MSAGVMEQTELTVKSAPPAQPFPITLTEKAAEEVARHVAEQKAAGVADEFYLRISVRGGGCSGFQDKLDLDVNYNEKTDLLSEQLGVKVVVDKKSALYISGTTVDFHSDLNARGFRLINPNAKKQCGCGSSYSM